MARVFQKMSEDAATTELKPARQKRHRADERPTPQPRYNVILWNDNDHTYVYVIKMLSVLFGHTYERGYRIAQEVDKQGRAIVLTTTKEHAELKRDQIHAYGKDQLLDSCKGSMSATIEAVPAE
jgi:ATP-dependent Clp protease adaptor protein ClpS